MKILNMSKNIKAWVVARKCAGEWWYYGTYEDRDRANMVALEVRGAVFSGNAVE